MQLLLSWVVVTVMYIRWITVNVAPDFAKMTAGQSAFIIFILSTIYITLVAAPTLTLKGMAEKQKRDSGEE